MDRAETRAVTGAAWAETGRAVDFGGADQGGLSDGNGEEFTSYANSDTPVTAVGASPMIRGLFLRDGYGPL